MSVNTKAFIATPCKDICFVAARVQRALDALIRPLWKSNLRSDAPAQYQLTTTELCPDSALVRFHFQYEGQNRTMWLFFDCDCDRVEYAPQSLTLSMGCSGRSDLFIKTAAHALSMLGPVYYDYNDCDDVSWELLQEQPALNFVSACQQRVASVSQHSLKQWLACYDQKLLRPGAFEEIVGIPRQQAEELLGMPYQDAQNALKQLVAQP